MRKFVLSFLFLAICSPIAARASGGLQSVKEETEETWAGTGAQDATFTAVSISMIGWGVGLAGGIAILASAIHQSSSSHDSSSCSH